MKNKVGLTKILKTIGKKIVLPVVSVAVLSGCGNGSTEIPAAPKIGDYFKEYIRTSEGFYHDVDHDGKVDFLRGKNRDSKRILSVVKRYENDATQWGEIDSETKIMSFKESADASYFKNRMELSNFEYAKMNWEEKYGGRE